MSIKHYVEFIFGGAFLTESRTEPVVSRDVRPPVPTNAIGFRFFSRTETLTDGELLTGEHRDFSPTTYFGKTYTLEEVKTHGDFDTRTLIWNMECNGWKRVVRTKNGMWLPLNAGDKVEAP